MFMVLLVVFSVFFWYAYVCVLYAHVYVCLHVCVWRTCGFGSLKLMSVVSHGHCPSYILTSCIDRCSAEPSASLANELVGVQFPISAFFSLRS